MANGFVYAFFLGIVSVPLGVPSYETVLLPLQTMYSTDYFISEWQGVFYHLISLTISEGILQVLYIMCIQFNRDKLLLLLYMYYV